MEDYIEFQARTEEREANLEMNDKSNIHMVKEKLIVIDSYSTILNDEIISENAFLVGCHCFVTKTYICLGLSIYSSI